MLIDLAFPGLSIGERAILKNASRRVDSALMGGQFPSRAYEHSMRAQGETVQQARAKAAAFYDSRISDARSKLADSVAHAGDGSGRSEAMKMSSLQSVGEAMHMVADGSSPEHRGFQIWAPLAHPFESFLHPGGEKTIDSTTQTLVVKQLQVTFATVYGDNELKRAVSK
jgi:hypothetical protein